MILVAPTRMSGDSGFPATCSNSRQTAYCAAMSSSVNDKQEATTFKNSGTKEYSNKQRYATKRLVVFLCKRVDYCLKNRQRNRGRKEESKKNKPSSPPPPMQQQQQQQNRQNDPSSSTTGDGTHSGTG